MFCSKCGTKLNENGMICPACGNENSRPNAALQNVQPMPNAVPPQIPKPYRELLTFNMTVHILTIIAMFTYAFLFGILGIFVSFIGLFAKAAFAPGSVMLVLAGILGITAITTVIMTLDQKQKHIYTDSTHYFRRETILFTVAAAIFFIFIALSVISFDFDIPKTIETFNWHEVIMLIGVVINVIAAVANGKNLHN